MAKIIHIITRLDMGGSAQNTLMTCNKLGDKYETVLVHGASLESRMTSGETEMVTNGIEGAKLRSVRFYAIGDLVRKISPMHDFKVLVALCRLMRKEKPDIVHTHTSKAGILGRLAAFLAGVPYTVHTAHGHVFYGHFGRVSSLFFLWLERVFGIFTDRFIALTEGERADYIKYLVGSPENIETIHSGVDIDAFGGNGLNLARKKSELGFPPENTVIGFAGWLLPIKGPLDLVNAMGSVLPEHPQTTLALVGKGDQEEELRKRASQLSANGNYKFLGWRNDIEEIMPLFDIFVLPSLNEGMGRVLVEAMAASKPVVASNVGGIPDLVKHGENGLLVPPGDEKALAGSIKYLIAHPDEARAMGEKGREFCQKFSLDAMIDKIDKLYMDLLGLDVSESLPPLQAAQRTSPVDSVNPV